ncbi:hypothetical protein CTAYLR_009428 [Chrysophaeum taylorii]|uniref:Protein kinase domain-containing protein n=1 Tax=Chrysophaeum taylorii TaxID=2483200 RepID=A0AAD7XRK8_9STRA|nr:hypothetical protein CTAYLR_009428 [Chrysophaeum taylorii]
MRRRKTSDDELSRVLAGAGMPASEVPKLIGALNQVWKEGESIDDLPDDVLERWHLEPSSMLLLKSILESFRGDDLSVDLSSSKYEEEYEEDFEDDDDDDDDAEVVVNLATLATTWQQQQRRASGEQTMAMSTSFSSPPPANPPTEDAGCGVMSRPSSISIDSPAASGSRLGLEAKRMLSSAVGSDDEAPAIIQNQWKMGKCIGSGSFGAVYTCMDEATGHLMAVKIVAIPTSEICFAEPRPPQSELRALCSEIEVMRSLQHANIVRYFGAHVDEPNLQLYIFQEWVPGGSLASLSAHYGAFAESVVRRYTVHILEGLIYLHRNHIIHRDIKCGNVLVDESGVAKLADFGASHRLGKDGTLTADMKLATMRGTPYFMAPEILQQDKFGRRSDVWSVGGVVLQMATTDPPWKALAFRTPMALFYHVASTTDPPPLDTYTLSSGLRDFILRCFIRDAQRRPHATDLRRDPFLLDDDDLDIHSLHHLHDLHQRKKKHHRLAPAPTRSRGHLSDLKMRMSLRGVH